MLKIKVLAVNKQLVTNSSAGNTFILEYQVVIMTFRTRNVDFLTCRLILKSHDQKKPVGGFGGNVRKK